MGSTSDRLREGLVKLQQRETEGLAIFRPELHQVPIFTSHGREVLVQGGVRSGKSICVAAVTGGAATGSDILGPDGLPFEQRFPRDRPLVIWLIGYGEKHIGQTFHRLLFTPQIKMVRDRETGKWRSFNPHSQDDWERDMIPGETQLAQPFIPKRVIAGWGWKNKSIRHFEICRLKPRPEWNGRYEHGTVIYAFTSLGEPKMGDPVDLIWIDEQFKYPEHYHEWQSRTSDRKGRIIVSQWPGRGNAAIKKLISRAEQSMRQPPPRYVEYVRLKFSDNPYIDQSEKIEKLRAWEQQGGHELRLSRDEGTILEERHVYPGFSPLQHTCPAVMVERDDKVDDAIRRNGHQPPMDWCIDVILDPGHANPGVLLCATPPSELGKAYVVYDEIFAPQTNARELAAMLEIKLRNRSAYRFIIDRHAAQATLVGPGITINQIYSDAFEEVGLKCETSGRYFTFSSDKWEADVQLVRERMMTDVKTGRPWLRIITNNCPNLVHQLEFYHKRRAPDGTILDKPAQHQIDPLCDCLRYWVASDPKYSCPLPVAKKPNAAYLMFLEDKLAKERDADKSIRLGPPTKQMAFTP